MRASFSVGLCLSLAAAALGSAPSEAHAEEAAATHLSLGDTARLARERGFDVVIAAAQVHGAAADVTTAGAVPNPSLNGNVGWTLSCGSTPCNNGTPWGWGVGVSDQGLIEGFLSRKRVLRQGVAERALAAAKFGRADAERILVAQAKIQYMETVAAAMKVDFMKEVAASLAKSVEVNRVRYPRIIDEGQLFRVEQEGLKADQEVDRARRDLRQQQIELAFVVGMAGPIPEVVVDKDAIKFRVPDALASANRDALFRIAVDNRPDRRQAQAKEAQSSAQIALSRRLRFPDISLSAQYAQQGSGDYTSQLPTLTVGASLPLPLFYRQEGEIRRAEADREVAALTLRRLDATVVGDIESAYNAFTTERSILERFEATLLDKAKRARDITKVQYDAGSATLTDLLDAQRSFVQVNIDYEAELVNYWTSVFQLEQAVGKELVP